MKNVLFLMIIVVPLVAEPKYIDFEDTVHEAIIDIRQIEIPEFPGAFNGSIITWQDRLLLCFRVRDENLVSTFQFGCVYLDEQFNPISNPHIVAWDDANPSPFSQMQDPRLMVVHDTLYIVFSNFTTVEEITTRRMFVAQLIEKDGRFVMRKPVCIDAPNRLNSRWEKNWVPFIYENELLLSYCIAPHYVIKPSLIYGGIINDFWSTKFFEWAWGELRGGTPAIRDGDSYIAFFHSSLLMQSVHSKGKKIQHYVMGAYRFQAMPPFALTHMSAQPIVGKGFYHGKEYQTWKPLRVIFPMGCIVGKDRIWVSYGRQDFEMWVVTFDKQKLYESLVPCTEINDELIQPHVKMTHVSVRSCRA